MQTPPLALAVPAGHGMHASPVPSENWPAGHAVHASAPVAPRVSRPAAQSTHEVLPARAPRLATVLTGHGVHASPAPVLIRPDAQATQAKAEVLPVAATPVPAGHVVHAAWPVLALNVLAAHAISKRGVSLGPFFAHPPHCARRARARTLAGSHGRITEGTARAR
jgi:hypothetical protein